jgi:hypothetical protein
MGASPWVAGLRRDLASQGLLSGSGLPLGNGQLSAAAEEELLAMAPRLGIRPDLEPQLLWVV